MMQITESATSRKRKITSALQIRYGLVFKIAVSLVATMISSSNMGFLSPSVFLVRWKEQSNFAPAIESLRHPFYRRVLYLYSNETMPITLKKVRKDTSWTAIRYSESYIDSLCNEFYSRETSEAYTDTCVPMASWQVKTYPTCNTIHELDLLSGILLTATKESNVIENAKLIGKGGSRLVFRISDENIPGNFTYDLALKVSRFDRDFDPISYENQRVDAVASERLTAAPDVMDVYGFCALSALNELSSGFDVRQIVKRLSLWDPLEIVEMVFQASTALARVHSIDYKDTLNATLVHNDVTHNNYVVSNRGRLKLTDFNLSVLLRWNITSDRSCGFLQRRFGGAGGIHVVSLRVYVVRTYPSKAHKTATRWLSLCITFFHKNSPPESLYGNTTLLSEKVDVYGIGTLIFQLLTSQELYHQELIDLNISRNDEQKVLKLITAGVEPQLPEAVEGSNDTAILGLKKIMREALNYNVTHRPTALELKKKLQGIFHSSQEHREAQKSLSLKLLFLSKNK